MPRPSAREKLLDSAEELFAAHGLAGASLRAINAGAGLSPAALHYHFGGSTGAQQALVEALLGRRMPALMERRRQLLDALEARDTEPEARDVLDALARPLAELLAEGGEPGLRYLRMIQRLYADGDLDAATVAARFPGGVERIVPLLRRALPELPLAVLQLRLALAIDVMLQSFARGPRLEGAPLDAQVGALLDFVSGGLAAPTTPDPGESP